MIPPLGITSHPARILIVDDDRRNREHLEVALASQDLVLLTANSGEEALAMVSQQRPRERWTGTSWTKSSIGRATAASSGRE